MKAIVIRVFWIGSAEEKQLHCMLNIHQSLTAGEYDISSALYRSVNIKTMSEKYVMSQYVFQRNEMTLTNGKGL